MQICSIGECMTEFNTNNNLNYKSSFAGDTANTAIYLSRLGAKVTYVTSIGVDKLSDRMITFLKKEKINTKFIIRNSRKTVGLYIVENNLLGERNFNYWRSDSAAKFYFQMIDINKFSKFFYTYDLIYFSGITLSIYNEKNLSNFYQFLKLLKKKKIKICMDLNMRIKNWKSKKHAKETIMKFYKITDLVFFTNEDIQSIGISSNNLFNKIFNNPYTIHIYRKNSGKIHICERDSISKYNISLKNKVVDTTACGDAFNAAFIFHYLKNASFDNCVKFAHKLAKRVAHNKGAIIPKEYFRKEQYV